MTAVNTSSAFFGPKGASARKAYYTYLLCVLAALAAAAVLVSAEANAQTADGTVPAASQAASSPAAPAAFSIPSASPTTAKSPRYSATEIARAFNFMDANKDGKISREEAAGFRNVARHFDAADTSKDGALSLEELANALNRP